MDIYHLGRLCLLVTALLSIDPYTKFSLISLTFSAAKSCSYLFKLLSKRPEVGSSHFSQFVTGIALFFAFLVWLKAMYFSLRPSSHLRHGDCLNSKICDLLEPLERPNSEFEDGNAILNGDSRSFEGPSYSDSEGSLHEDQVLNEMCLRECSLGSDVHDSKELFGRPSWLIENGHSVSNGNPHSDAGSENSKTEAKLFPEDQTSDEILLRDLVKFERQRAEAALSELEKERLAATTAAEEAMSMIMRLQREKSSIEIEAKQYRRLAEGKQVHDQEVIGFLRSVIGELERDLNALAEELFLCSRRLSSRDRCNCTDGADGFEDGAEEYDLSNDNGDSAMGVSFDEELENDSISYPVFDVLAL